MNVTLTSPELVALARSAAQAHGLWPELVCAIVEQESAWDPWALRYEPAFYEKYIVPQAARGAVVDITESRARAFSWGLMQVMGQVAREHGFTAVSLASLCDPAAGLEIGCRVFAAKLAAAEGNATRRAAPLEWGRESGLPRLGACSRWALSLVRPRNSAVSPTPHVLRNCISAGRPNSTRSITRCRGN